jgi:hypothetical protein
MGDWLEEGLRYIKLAYVPVHLNRVDIEDTNGFRANSGWKDKVVGSGTLEGAIATPGEIGVPLKTCNRRYRTDVLYPKTGNQGIPRRDEICPNCTQKPALP